MLLPFLDCCMFVRVSVHSRLDDQVHGTMEALLTNLKSANGHLDDKLNVSFLAPVLPTFFPVAGSMREAWRVMVP